MNASCHKLNLPFKDPVPLLNSPKKSRGNEIVYLKFLNIHVEAWHDGTYLNSNTQEIDTGVSYRLACATQ